MKIVWGRVGRSHVAVRGLDWPDDIAFSPHLTIAVLLNMGSAACELLTPWHSRGNDSDGPGRGTESGCLMLSEKRIKL